MKSFLHIAMLTHSTNPRGGVVHAMALSDALSDLGHHLRLFAPDSRGTGFFRQTRCSAVGIPVGPASLDITAMVEQRIAEYVDYFAQAGTQDFDLFHAHDGISGNALATLKERGLINGFVRTVHHIDSFVDPTLMALQERSILSADAHFSVSRKWQAALQSSYGIQAEVVGNGVDLARYSPAANLSDHELRKQLGLGPGPVFLSVGGVEERKNTLSILEAFLEFRNVRPDSQLLIAGGVSLLDHETYRARFDACLRLAGPNASNIHILGPINDRDMPALYRLADSLIFPSIKEGFGLVVLEAMASGAPVVTSAIEPFTEYLEEHDVIWCKPDNLRTIIDAMELSLNTALREVVIPRGLLVAKRHDWKAVAKSHLRIYHSLEESAYA
ncbi:MSMEG_0565 family glycosyltransferase [Phyllobacterium sp. LjRoot231]|uniref:MSMEG_0565 family glycosyltransferase n=1 Tax=Phyllobacterium sp. LjRoot231 TaxID=3342289 RepID=UPI003ED08195